MNARAHTKHTANAYEYAPVKISNMKDRLICSANRAKKASTSFRIRTLETSEMIRTVNGRTPKIPPKNRNPL